MKLNSKTLALVTTTAMLFANVSLATNQYAAASSTTTDKPVKCMGINACKGQSGCKTAANACKGQNSCKGKGWLMVDNEKECVDKGGTVVKHSD
jgi:hypothetical protein